MLASLSYQNVLQRGFALVRDETGRAVRSVAAVAAGQRLEIELGDGRLGAVAGNQAVAGTSPPRAQALTSPAPARVTKPRRGNPGDQGSLF